MFERPQKIAAPAIDAGQRVVAGSTPGATPGCFEKSPVGFFISLLKIECQPEVIVGLSIVRVGVPAGEPLDGAAEMALSVLELATAQMRQAKRLMAVNIIR